jgi:hypothetical protein
MKNVLRIGPPGLVKRHATLFPAVPSEVAVSGPKGENRRNSDFRPKRFESARGLSNV